MFPASTLHACTVRFEKIRKSWRPMRTSEGWVDFTVLSSNFVCFKSVFDQLNLLKYCGVKVNGSKKKPSRFLQVQLISVWLIRNNHCKLIKLTFFLPQGQQRQSNPHPMPCPPASPPPPPRRLYISRCITPTKPIRYKLVCECFVISIFAHILRLIIQNRFHLL